MAAKRAHLGSSLQVVQVLEPALDSRSFMDLPRCLGILSRISPVVEGKFMDLSVTAHNGLVDDGSG